jgi:hypothetical protein
MNHSRTSGDSRRQGKRLLRIYSYLNRLDGFVNGRLNRLSRARGAGVEKPTTGNAIRHADEEKLSILGPSTIECFGPEAGGPVVLVDVEHHGEKTVTVKLRCGLVAGGGES